MALDCFFKVNGGRNPQICSIDKVKNYHDCSSVRKALCGQRTCALDSAYTV